jgi:hypothetical protein
MTNLICEPVRPTHFVVIDALPDTEGMLEFVERLCATEAPREVCITEKLNLTGEGGDVREQLRWLELIRDFTACGVHVRWSARHIDPDLLSKLPHLAPPQMIESAAESVGLWKARHVFGMFHWRLGPGFATLIDKRHPEFGNEYVLDDPHTYAIFRQARKTSLRKTLEDIDTGALERLESENILLTLSGWSLALPYRMTHWPVPYTAV